MPIAKIQLPNGKIGRFDVPEGTSPEQVMQFVQDNLSQFETQEPKQAEPQTHSVDIPEWSGEPLTTEQKQQNALARVNAQMDKLQRDIYGMPLIGGIVKGVQDIGLGGSQLLARGVDAITGGNTDLSTSFDKAINRSEQNYQDVNQGKIGQDVARIAGGFVGGGNVASAGKQLAKKGLQEVAKRIAIGAGIGAGTAPVIMNNPGNQNEFVNEKAWQVGTGLATGGVLEGGAYALSSDVADAVKPLAKRAREFGINLRLDQVDPSRVKKTAQKISQNVPFSGVDAQETLQRTQWNKAVAGTLGKGIEDLTPQSIQKFTNQNSAKYDRVLKNTKINIFPDDAEILQEQLFHIKENVSPIQYQKIENIFKKIIDDFQKGTQSVDFKMVSASKINGLKSNLMRLALGAKGDAKNVINETTDFVHDILMKSLPANKQKLLAQANREYRNYKTLQPLLEKSPSGEINPTMLLNRVGSNKYINASSSEVGKDDLVDLARIGKTFLPKAGGSDTFEKSATAGITVAGAFEPTVALGAGATIAGNRALQAVNQSQKLVDKAIQGTNVNVPDGITEGITRAISGQTQSLPDAEPFQEMNNDDFISRLKDEYSNNFDNSKNNESLENFIDSLRQEYQKPKSSVYQEDVKLKSSFTPYIKKYARKNDIDPNLIAAIIKKESNFKKTAQSSVGAKGLMQIMPETASDPGYGVKPFDKKKSPYDVAENIRFGTDYFKAMLKKFNGDIEASLIAYNAGVSNADKWLQSGRDYSVLPDRKQTEDYAKTILKNYEELVA